MNDKQILDNILERRYSCRSFLKTPVEQKIIEEILSISQKIPSWCNAQPWEVTICSGSALKTLSKNLLNESETNQTHSDIPFPLQYTGIYRERRKECGLQLYNSVGIKKGETEKALLQMRENFKFFGAPHIAIITSERSLGVYGAIDCGAFVSAFTIAASSMKISTIPQAAIASLSNVVRKTLNIANGRDIICAISFGYENAEHPVNKFRTSRAKLSEVVNWIDSID